LASFASIFLQDVREFGEKGADLRGVAKNIMSRRALGLTDEDCDASTAERPKGVLVGEIVADVERQDVRAPLT
jgi:hypothetical protein